MKEYINLLPEVERGPRAVPAWTWWAALGVLLMVVGGIFGREAWALWNLDRERQAWEARKSVLLQEAQTLSQKLGISRAQVRDWEEAATRARIVQDLMSRRIPWAAVLAELARLVPEEVWLTRIETLEGPSTPTGSGLRTGPGLRVQGGAIAYPQVNRFVAALERTARFDDVQVLSIKVDKVGGREQAVGFSLTCRINPVQNSKLKTQN